MARSVWSDDEVRSWFINHGWEPEPTLLYDEEGVDGWQWTHSRRPEEFAVLGDHADAPAVSEAMREFMIRERRDWSR